MLTATEQGILGDDTSAQQTRLAALHEECRDKLVVMGEGGFNQPKHALHFTIDLKYKTVGGQQLSCKCMFCFKIIHSTGASRVVDHFNNCVLCPAILKELCEGLRAGTAAKRKEKEAAYSMLTEERDIALKLIKSQKVEMVQQGIKSGFKSAEATCADLAIARFFYANGINFGAARETGAGSYYREMIVAIQSAGAGYTPPNSNALAGQLIDVAHNTMTKDVARRDANGEISTKFGSTYTSDGWDSCDHLPLINSAIITANDGGAFVRSVDTSGHTKNAEYVAALMIADIYLIGPLKMVAVCTDTCSTMQKAWGIVVDEFPWFKKAPNKICRACYMAGRRSAWAPINRQMGGHEDPHQHR